MMIYNILKLHSSYSHSRLFKSLYNNRYLNCICYYVLWFQWRMQDFYLGGFASLNETMDDNLETALVATFGLFHCI